MGMQRLLELTRAKHSSGAPVFIQISTDEVYGDIVEGKHTESDPLMPSNPYSSTKAAADMMVLGWARTYGVQYNIVRMTNNYGPYQYHEKLIPKSALRMRRGLPALMHGDGSYFRSWLHVEDSVRAIVAIIEKGGRNTIYNVHGNCELRNIEVIKKIANILGVPEEEAYKAVPNRAGQDVRYSLDDSRIRALGWEPKKDFDEELKKIVFEDDFTRFL
jgi:dTDP-glucose 4,6-dehydratase